MKLQQINARHQSLALRTVASRNGVKMLSENYFEWEDILNKELTLRVPGVRGYNYPDVNSGVYRIYARGNTIVPYSYLYVNGKVWIMYYANQLDYDSFNASWILLSGQPGDTLRVPVSTIQSVFDTGEILTQAQEDAQAAEENETVADKALTMLKWGVGIAAVTYLIGKAI